MSRKLKKPSKVVVSGEIKQGPFRLLREPKRIALVVVACVAGVLVIVGGVTLTRMILDKNKKTSVQRSSICTDKGTSSIAGEAAGFLNPARQQELKGVIDRIQKLPGYEKDPNCLFPITQYYINRNDKKNAIIYYDKLALVYDSKAGFYENYRGYAKNMEDVKKAIDQVVQYNDQVQKNVRYMKQ